MTTLISADNTFALLTVFLGLAAFGFWAETTRLGKLMSGVILVIVAGLALANLRVVPFAGPFYDLVWGYAVPLAIPLLLFKADLKRILPEAGPLLIGFAVAVIGTIAGIFAGFYLVGLWGNGLGENGAVIVGTIGASWIGGSVNFAAVSQALEISDATLLSAMAAADNVGGTLFLLLLVTLPSVVALRRFIPSRIIEQAQSAEAHAAEEKEDALTLNMFHLALLLSLSALCCALGYGLGHALGTPQYGILFVTLFALAIANFAAERMAKLHGDFQLGMLFMLVFFGVMGAGANVALMIETALPIFGFVAIMAAVHLAVVLAAAKLFKLDLAEALLTSNAVALGPAPAAAMAASQRWRQLVTPAVMLGVLGYAIANFLGVGLANFLG